MEADKIVLFTNNFDKSNLVILKIVLYQNACFDIVMNGLLFR